MTDLVPIRRALISVSDKTGLKDLAAMLAANGVALISTGGTARALRDMGHEVRDVSDLTGSPEMMDGRVKTLHPAVHGGLLALRDHPDHVAAMKAHGIDAIDLLVVNLYPFEATVASGAVGADCIENIDIGGPAMIRAAAKNHAHVVVLTDPEDYPALRDEIAAHDGATGLAFRRRAAMDAFGRTASYDAAVASWMADRLEDAAPRNRIAGGTRVSTLRYGENPHQRAALYRSSQGGVVGADLIQGKELSYNNVADADAALALAAEFRDGPPACVIVKHANPCGVAQADTLTEAYGRAFDCDRTSAFGGIVAVNRPLDADTARAMAGIFTEVVIAPDADDAARAVFAERKNLRLMLTGALPDPRRPALAMRQVSGGWLVQDADTAALDPAALRIVSRTQPTEAQMADLLFAWTVAKHVKSNAIVYARDAATVGIGAGQMSRVDSTRIAARKAADMAEALGLSASPAEGSVVASDAFFPFPDGLLAAAGAGARAVIQPGGSVRDAEVIAVADEAGIAMVFTGQRHFRH
ncbi:bifunctional phosphoribosylaminoimidazolecarboxamide formyltransferase/IMP cyclohydrolase [Oceaniovalibus guishaninsula JLT2003]|uniref:Bifunctional purine biosynthesis protein PurH n=1 Tax=Oceaniovalibus guishaninsula JLT2003 TaxID=1231392 RepID=K2HA05_9RHOB|nr:bifunctional phosphoribosylaminoimidazolecarboxamide formyltransferase/IMP cyclohydrolase [Oceaniovalibus guishaninsula]EKE43457.1 bifunctional phosphoribosylaminoimidazolecarboxamide formyltransferase/IMP cyclohydrolase [Oceaniovalibus guishaninsula JLT2003]